MGAWGPGIIENDTAMDIVYQIEDEKDLSIIIPPLIQVNEEYHKGENIDLDLASETIVATEIVAVLTDGISDNLSLELNKWLKKS